MNTVSGAFGFEVCERRHILKKAVNFLLTFNASFILSQCLTVGGCYRKYEQERITKEDCEIGGLECVFIIASAKLSSMKRDAYAVASIRKLFWCLCKIGLKCNIIIL